MNGLLDMKLRPRVLYTVVWRLTNFTRARVGVGTGCRATTEGPKKLVNCGARRHTAARTNVIGTARRRRSRHHTILSPSPGPQTKA